MSMKRVISLLVALSMLLTVCGGSAFAAGQTGYSDVDGTGYETAVSILQTLGVMSGYTDGQFHPYSTITRAEMAELAVRLRGITDYGTVVSDEEIQYKDMAGHPLAAAVAYARSLGIVDGSTDGNFYPDEPVTYEQAVKMIVGAVGYDYYATSRAPYPNGYLTVANELRLTSGIGVTPGAYITRGDVAKIACNALTVDMMVEKSFSDDSKITYEIIEGKNILNTYFNVEKIRGVVEENEYTGLYGETTLEPGEVRISGEIFHAGLTNIGDYLGYYVSFYAIESEIRDRRIIISYKVESNRNDYIKINAEDIENVSFGDNAYVIDYWRSSSAKAVSHVSLSSTPTVIFNGVALSDFTLEDLKPKYGQVTLMDTDNDREYDFADIISYDVMTVLSASDASGMISAYPAYTTGMRSARLKVDDDDEDNVTIRIIDGNGNNVALSNIKKNTVLFVAISKDSDSTVRTAIVSNDSITGTVNAVTAEGDLMINGQQYDIISYMEGALSVGDSGTFFLTHDGRIAGFDGEQKVSKNIGMFVSYNHGKLSEGGDVVKIFKADGSMGIYNLAGTVKLNGQNVNGSDLFDMISDENSPLFGRREPDSSNAGKVIAEPAKAGILFKLNSNGDISEIVYNDKNGANATVRDYESLPSGTYGNNELRGVVQRGRSSGWYHTYTNDVWISEYEHNFYEDRQKVCGDKTVRDFHDSRYDDVLYYSWDYRCFHKAGMMTYVTDSTVLMTYGDDWSYKDDSQAYGVRMANQLGNNEFFEWYEMYFYYFGNSEYPEFIVCFDDFNTRPGKSSSNSSSYTVPSLDEDWGVMGGTRKNISIVDRIVEEYGEDDQVKYRLYYWDSGTTKNAAFHEYFDYKRFRDGDNGSVLWRRGDMVRFVFVNGTSEIGDIESIFRSNSTWNDPTDQEKTGGFNSFNRYKFPVGKELFAGNQRSWRQIYQIGRITAIDSAKYFTTIDLNVGNPSDGLDNEILSGACYKLQYNNRGYISGVETVGIDSLAEGQLVLVHRQGQTNNLNLRIIETYILYEYEDIEESQTLRRAYASIYPDDEWGGDATVDSVNVETYDNSLDGESVDEALSEKVYELDKAEQDVLAL